MPIKSLDIDELNLRIINEAASLDNRSFSSFVRIAARERAIQIFEHAGVDWRDLKEE